MSALVIGHARLDRRLEILARRPERFVRDALRLCAAFDARGLELEITDPKVWRAEVGSPRVAIESQFRSDVERVRTLDRKEELRLALRIEFARLRLDRRRPPPGPDGKAMAGASDLASAVRRRRLEWHALRTEMVERNLYLVLITVGRYKHTSAERSDLIQAGAAALFEAVDAFDWRRGVLFRTYATYWLTQGSFDHLHNFARVVRVPVYVLKSMKHVDAAVQRLGNPRASVEELARATGLTEHTVRSARTAGLGTRSLDAPLDAVDGATSLASVLAVEEDEGSCSAAVGDMTLASGIEMALAVLSERERRVVELRFGIGCSRAHVFSEVAGELGVSLERARQILVRAISKMRAPRLRRALRPLVP